MQIYKTKRKMAAWINVDICCSIASEQHDPLASLFSCSGVSCTDWIKGERVSSNTPSGKLKFINIRL